MVGCLARRVEEVKKRFEDRESMAEDIGLKEREMRGLDMEAMLREHSPPKRSDIVAEREVWRRKREMKLCNKINIFGQGRSGLTYSTRLSYLRSVGYTVRCKLIATLL